MMRIALAIALALLAAAPVPARAEEPYGIGLEGFPYPYPVALLPLTVEGEPQRLAYMDVKPTGPANGRTALLLHGRNFPSSYWEPTIKALSAAGFRVVVPDQLGFGKSSKPTFVIGYDQHARDMVALLDHLQIDRVSVVAHSMGGMLAVRFTRTYPGRVDRLLLAAPIGLEDYRLYAPPVETERLIEQEDKLTAEAYRKQLVTNYSLTLPPDAVTPFIDARFRIKGAADYPRWLRAFVNSYQTIYRDPTVYELPSIRQPTLFVMGGNDHNAPGRPFAPEEVRAQMGQNAKLAEALAARMPDARVEVFDGVGHLVPLEAEQRFNAAMLKFLDGGQ
jgi:pimeloyl-ACP methyl ester carboxylesterase